MTINANIDMHDYDAWRRHIEEESDRIEKEYDRIMKENEKIRKEIDKEYDRIMKEADNINNSVDYMMLVDQQNYMIAENRHMIECQQNIVNQQNLLMINILHHGF